MSKTNCDESIYKSVLSCFRYGRANAIHQKQLQKLTSLDSRQLRKIIELIRRNGVCVVSDNNGYYLPETREELEQYIRRTEKMARSIFFTLQTAKKALKSIDENPDK